MVEVYFESLDEDKSVIQQVLNSQVICLLFFVKQYIHFPCSHFLSLLEWESNNKLYAGTLPLVWYNQQLPITAKYLPIYIYIIGNGAVCASLHLCMRAVVVWEENSCALASYIWERFCCPNKAHDLHHLQASWCPTSHKS